MISGRPLEHLVANRPSRHNLTTVQNRIKCRELLRERQLGLTKRLDQDVRILS